MKVVSISSYFLKNDFCQYAIGHNKLNDILKASKFDSEN